MLRSLDHLEKIIHGLSTLSKKQNDVITFQTIRNAHVGISKFKLYKLKKGPPTEAELEKEEALMYYRDMQRIRRMEQAAHNAYLAKDIRGFLHLANGQEACYVGMKAAMRDNDDCISAYRIHGLAYVMGVSVKAILAELCSKVTGSQRGKGGSMHIYAKHFYGGNGIVGAQIPVGAGIAFANKYKGNGAVCFTLFGDGASNQGQCFEAYNIAAIWKLPCIFVCENNGYAMGTSVPRHSAMSAMYKKGHYMPGLWINGMDVLSVREGCKFAIEYAVEKGPIMLEFATYRYYGHSMSDPGKSYRSREEVQEVRKKKDPIGMMKKRIFDCKLASKEDLKKIEDDAQALVDKAMAEIKKEPEPGLDEIAADIYSKYESHYGNVRDVVPWKSFKHKRIGEAINFK